MSAKHFLPLPEGELPADLLSVSQAARQENLHMATVYRWIMRGKLRAWRRGGRVFVSRAELAAMYQPVVPYADMPHPPSAREERERKRITDEGLRRFKLK